jgi:hypothetical protein
VVELRYWWNRDIISAWIASSWFGARRATVARLTDPASGRGMTAEQARR